MSKKAFGPHWVWSRSLEIGKDLTAHLVLVVSGQIDLNLNSNLYPFARVSWDLSFYNFLVLYQEWYINVITTSNFLCSHYIKTFTLLFVIPYPYSILKWNKTKGPGNDKVCQTFYRLRKWLPRSSGGDDNYL